MFIIGLTGGIGSGKTTVSQLFAELGIVIIDTDVIARDVVKPNTPALAQIKQHFGDSVINSNNELDRSVLRKKIFANLQEKTWLENLLHPLIRIEAERQAASATSPYCIVVIPLLFETGKYAWLNRILVVEASPAMQISRVTQRDQCDAAAVEKIMQTQVSAAIRRQNADDIIENNGSIDDLRIQVKELHNFYLGLVKK